MSDQIKEWFDEAIAACDVPRTAPKGADAQAWERLQAAIQGWQRLATVDPGARARLIRFLVADYDLSGDEVDWCLGHLWSHLVNKYQGSLGEFLAAHELERWLSATKVHPLGPDARIVAGDHVRELRNGRDGPRWDRGADGLVVAGAAPDGEVWICGVVEIKSYPVQPCAMASQLERHLSRLRRGGLVVGGRHVAPTQVHPVRWGRRGWRDCEWDRVLRVLVSPPPSRRKPRRMAPGILHRLYLPVPKTSLAATAYRMTTRFLERLGREAFRDGSPWPEMTPEEAARNAVIQALYHVIVEQRTRRPSRAYVARRLYNVYGFGYDRASGHSGMLWPDGAGGITSEEEAAPDPPIEPPKSAPPRELLNGTWAWYRKGELKIAEAWLVKASAAASNDESRHPLACLHGRIRYHLADFAGAVEVMPVPPETPPHPDDGWWAKDMLLLIRAHARLGNSGQAAQLLERLVRAGSRWDHLKIAIPVAQGWIALGDGNSTQASTHADEAEAQLQALRADVRDREDRGLGDPPNRDIHAIQAAVVDLAALSSALGNGEMAQALVANLQGMPEVLAGLIRNDPLTSSPGRGPSPECRAE